MSDKMEKISITSEQEVMDECPYTPTTCYKKLRGVVSEVDDLVTFKKFEEMSNFEGEYKSLQLSIKDANVAALQEEIIHLKAELKQITETSDLDKKDANIKLFRLQQELEQKNIEILLLKKEKSEFDLQINLLKSRCARKEKDLQDALNVCHPGLPQMNESESQVTKLQTEVVELKASHDLLREELERSKFEIDNLEEVLKVKTDHAHLLTLAFDDILNDFKLISSEASELIDSIESNDPFTFDSLEPIDLSSFKNITDSINICLTPFNFEEYIHECDTSDVNTILKEAVSNLTIWFKSVLNDWQSHIDDWQVPDTNDIEELRSIYESFKNSQLNLTSTSIQNNAATSMKTSETIEMGLQTSFIVNPANSEEDNKLADEIEDLKNKLDESLTKIENLTNGFESTISSLKEENKELLQKYKSTRDILEEAERQQSLVEETTAEAVKELKEELGDRTVKLLLNGGQDNLNDIFVDVVIKEEAQWHHTSGMTTFLSAKDEPEPSICEDRDVTSTVGTAFALPREHSDNLVSFAREFAEFLLANQVFIAEDSLPTDPSVFYFLLDKYLMLVETYHQTRTAFEENLNALEEQDKVARVKAEALLSQLSQLEVTDSTLCDSSLTASSVDFDTDVRSSTMYENKLNDTSFHIHSFVENNDLTHDPLQITINNVPGTPLQARTKISLRGETPGNRRTSFNSSKIPVCRTMTPSAHMQTLQENSVAHSILLNGSVNDSKLPPSTPVQRIIRREACSTAKKSVTFQSPLLARNALECENSKLKAILDEKLSQIDKLEESVGKHVSNIAQIEERTVTLEKLSSEAYNALERAETEFSEKRDKLEAELNHVKCQLADVTNKLIIEAINLNPDLQNRLTAITPPQVLKILLDTIIARCEKEQEETKKTFEHDREEWSNEILQITASNQALHQKVDDLTSQNKQMALQSEELGVVEEDLLRLTAENIQLEKTNVNLVKELMEVQEKLETLKQEIVALKDQLFMAEGEKECLISDKSQLEQDKEKLGKEYDNQLKMLQDAMATKIEQCDRLNQEATELRNIITVLEETNAKVTKEHDNCLKNLNEKDEMLSTLREEVTVLNVRLQGLNNQNASLESVKWEEIQILQLELENSKKEHLSLQDEKNQMLTSLQGDIDYLKAQVVAFENEISQLKLSEANAANNRIEELDNLKLEMENSKMEQKNKLKILEEQNVTLQQKLGAVNELVATYETEIAKLHLSKTNADNCMVEEIESLKRLLENSQKEKEYNLNMAEEKGKALSTLQAELENSKTKIITLKNENSDLLLAKSNADNCLVEQLESLKIELENAKKENESHLIMCNDRSKTLEDEIETLKKQVSAQDLDIAGLQTIQSKADVENSENLKLLFDNECELKLLTEKNLALREELDAIEIKLLQLTNQVTLNEDSNKHEELESLKLSLENLNKEKERYESSLNQVISEKADAENNLKLAESAIEVISQKFMCESSLPTTLVTKINYLCNLVTKKLIDLEEENKRISLLEKEIGEVKAEKEEINIIMEQVKLSSQVLEEKVAQLEGDKGLVQFELTELNERITVMEADNDKLKNEIKEKDELLLSHSVELESLKIEIAEKNKELEENEEKLASVNQLEEQKQLVAAKDNEIRALQLENQSTLAELNNLKCEKEQILSQISTCTLQFESEIEKHQLATLKADNLQMEVDNLKEELECVRVFEENHKAEMDLIIIEKSKLEECLSAVEQNLRLAEERLLSAEARNNEFEAELLLLKDELIKNKETTEELSKKLSELETTHKEAKRDKTDLIEKLDKYTTLNNNLSDEKKEIKGQLDFVLVEKEDLLVKLTEISESKNELIKEKNCLVNRLEELKQDGSDVHSKYNQLTNNLEELTKIKNSLLVEKESLINELDDLKKSNETLSHDKNEISGKLTQITEKCNSETNELVKQLSNLEETKNGLTSEKESLLNDLAELTSAMKVFQEEKLKSEQIYKNEKELLILKLSEFSQARESLQAEKDMLTAKINELNQTLNGFTTEKDVLFKELQAVVEDRSVLVNDNKILQLKLTENEVCVKILTEEKSILITKLDEITQSRDILENENNAFVIKVQELSERIEKLTKDVVEKSKNIAELTTKLEYFDSDNEKLRENLEEYKKTESSMLKKLLEKNSSDEMVHHLQSQLKNAESIIAGLNTQVESMREVLKDKTNCLESTQCEVKQLKEIINNLTKDNDVLSNNFKEQNKELRLKSKSLDDVTAIMENLKCEVTKKEKESEEANSLLSERAEKINNLNSQMEKLCSSNAELKQLLSHVQVTLGLPQEAIQHLSADQNTRSRLRLFKDNVNGIQSKNKAISDENEKLTIELEKLTTEKVQFKIKEAEFHAFGREMDDKIKELTNTLKKLESAPSRRSKRQDPIGPRRLEKLEELNTTLHDLLMKILSMLQMPNVDKLRLISQREVDAATTQILDHVATLANARDSLEALKEQIKSLDQENQELSDNLEALLKDNNKLELRIVEFEKSHQSTACCDCIKLRKSLKEKTAEVDELSTRVKELDEENESLSNDVEALLKDNNNLEMKLIEHEKGTGSMKTCSMCTVLKNNLKTKEDEMRELEISIKKNVELLHAAEEELQKMKEKCEQLESSLSNKEQYLLRAINERVRGDEVRMSGVTGGMVRDIDLNEKLRRLTKDNDALKVLLRERARTIKKYEAEQKSSLLTSTEPNAAMNTNCMDSPIRERSYNLRTRADLPVGNKRSLRPHSEGIENIRI